MARAEGEQGPEGRPWVCEGVRGLGRLRGRYRSAWMQMPRRRRSAFASLTALSLVACAPGQATLPPANPRHGQKTGGFIPTPQAPRTDGRLTLIWFFEPE